MRLVCACNTAINSWSTPLRRSAWVRARWNCQRETAFPTNSARMMKRKQSVKRGPILKRCRWKVLPPTFFADLASFASTWDSLLLSSAYAPDRQCTNAKPNASKGAWQNGSEDFTRPRSVGRRSRSETRDLNQFPFQSCRCHRWSLFASQHGMQCPDVRSAHILIFLARNYGRTGHHAAWVLPRSGKLRIRLQDFR